jgi:tetratricopeptide (TPR) repeat protein
MRVEQAMELLPDTDDLIPLRAAVAGAAEVDGSLAWSGSEAYATLDTRLLDAEALEAALPEVVERVRARVEAVYGRVAAALRAAAAGDDAGAARALVEAGEAEEGAGRLDAAAELYRRAAELGRRPRDRSAEGLALRRLGRAARARGELDRSLRLYHDGYGIAEAMGDAEGMVVACQGMGNVLSDQGRWEEAAGWYARGLGRVGESRGRTRWQLEINLSNVARRAGRVEESEDWLKRAERTAEALGDDAARVYLRNALGLLRWARGDAAGAEAAYREALADAGAPAERATVLINLAEALVGQLRLKEAEATVRELERTALAYRLVGYLPHAYRALGAVARERRDAEGFVFYEQALTLCAQEGLPEMETALTQEEYGWFESELGSRESATARLEEARAIFARLGSGPELARVEERLRLLREEGF